VINHSGGINVHGWFGAPGRLLVAGAAALVVAGCAAAAPSAGTPTLASTTQSPATSGPPRPSGSVAPPATSEPPALSPSAASSGSPAPSDSQTEVTLAGVVIEGAQPSCRNLQTDDDGRYTLTGPGTAELALGDRVTVTGRPRPDLISPCGRVFVVTSLR
jgi:hypothetical protein